MGIMAIPIPMQVVSHSFPFPFPILSPIPITMGIPFPLAIPFPWSSLLYTVDMLLLFLELFTNNCGQNIVLNWGDNPVT